MKRMFTNKQIKDLASEVVEQLIQSGSIPSLKIIELNLPITWTEIGQDILVYTASLDTSEITLPSEVIGAICFIKANDGLVYPCTASDDLSFLSVLSFDGNGADETYELIYIPVQ